MEFEPLNGSAHAAQLVSPTVASNQETNRSYTKNGSFDFDTDAGDLNESLSFEKFETPSAKFQQQNDREHDLKRVAQVRQSLFKFDPLAEQSHEENGFSDVNNLTHDQSQLCSPILSKQTLLNHTLNVGDSNNLIQFNTPNIVNGSKLNESIKPFDVSLNNSLANESQLNQLNQSNHQNKHVNEIMAEFQQLLLKSSDQERQTNELKSENISLSNEVQTLQAKNQSLQDELDKSKVALEEAFKLNRSMAIAFDQTIDTFEIELQNREEQIESINFKYMNTLKEKEQTAEDLQGVEASFSNLHHRFEKMKVALEQCRANEESYKNQCLELSENLEEKEKLCAFYQNQVETSTENAKNLIEKSKKLTDREMISLKTQMKKAEMRINSLQNQLDQKIEENSELNKMIDELTNS